MASRALHGSSARFSNGGKVIEDPNKESNIFYHAFGNSRWAVTLFKNEPPQETHASVIGYVNAQADGKPAEYLRDHTDDFEENSKFWTVFEETIREQIIPNEDTIAVDAELRQNGWAPLVDQRHEVDPSRTPLPENIFGFVAFSDKKIHPDTYQRNGSYRFCTRLDGPMQLKKEWLKAVQSAVQSA